MENNKNQVIDEQINEIKFQIAKIRTKFMLLGSTIREIQEQIHNFQKNIKKL